MKAKTCIIIIINVSILINLYSQVGYNFILSSLDKIASDGEEKVKKVYANPDGSFFMCGIMTDTLQFGNQVAYMKCHGTTDFFVAYFKANQQCVWVKTFGGNDSDVAFSCCADNNKNVYVVGGYSSESIILGTSTFYNTHQGYSDLFIIKLDSTGNLLWAKSNTGIGFENQRIVACITDKENNLIVVGDHDGSFIWEDDTLADFNPPSTLSRDGFVAKFNADGNKLWIKHVYSYGHDEITSCTVDNSNNIYITGHFSYYYMDIDTVRINNCSSLVSGFIAKLTPQGVCLWAKRIDNVSSPSFCKFFKNNEIFWSNTMKGNAQLDTILFQNSATSPANFVLIKIDTNGNYLWSKNSMSYNPTYLTDVTFDHQGNLALCGYVEGKAIYIDNQPYGNLISEEWSCFVLGIDANGIVKWAYVSRNTSGINAGNVANSINFIKDKILVCGYFTSTTFAFNALQLNNTLAAYFDGLGYSYINTSDIFLLTLKSTNGIDENDLESIKIFPNPCIEKIYVENDNWEEIIAVELFQSDGKWISSLQMNEQQIRLPSTINTGIYWLKFITKKSIIVFKLLIVKS